MKDIIHLLVLLVAAAGMILAFFVGPWVHKGDSKDHSFGKGKGSQTSKPPVSSKSKQYPVSTKEPATKKF